MPSRVTVFDHFGVAIAELNTSTIRSWVLNDIGRCQFPIATFTDPNCTRDVLQYGNFVLVEHLPTYDEFGNVRGTLPPWIGIIFPPQEWSYGSLMVTSYSVEALLAYRPMPYRQVSGSAGTIYAEMLTFANALKGFPILAGAIYPDAPTTSVDLRLSMYEEARSLAKNFQQDWDITFTKSAANTLNLFANWYSQKGVTVQSVLSEGKNGNMKLPKLTEQGTIANVAIGYNNASSNGKRLTDTEQDEVSFGDYGILGVNQGFNVGSQAGVDISTLSYLQTHSRPNITLELTALDSGKTFDDIDLGNIWKVVLKSVGFYAGSIGFNGLARLTGFEYNDGTNEARLTTKILTYGLTEANYA